jgi:hypothetical protein
LLLFFSLSIGFLSIAQTVQIDQIKDPKMFYRTLHSLLKSRFNVNLPLLDAFLSSRSQQPLQSPPVVASSSEMNNDGGQTGLTTLTTSSGITPSSVMVSPEILSSAADEDRVLLSTAASSAAVTPSSYSVIPNSNSHLPSSLSSASLVQKRITLDDIKAAKEEDEDDHEMSSSQLNDYLKKFESDNEEEQLPSPRGNEKEREGERKSAAAYSYTPSNPYTPYSISNYSSPLSSISPHNIPPQQSGGSADYNPSALPSASYQQHQYGPSLLAANGPFLNNTAASTGVYCQPVYSSSFPSSYQPSSSSSSSAPSSSSFSYQQQLANDDTSTPNNNDESDLVAMEVDDHSSTYHQQQREIGDVSQVISHEDKDIDEKPEQERYDFLERKQRQELQEERKEGNEEKEGITTAISADDERANEKNTAVDEEEVGVGTPNIPAAPPSPDMKNEKENEEDNVADNGQQQQQLSDNHLIIPPPDFSSPLVLHTSNGDGGTSMSRRSTVTSLSDDVQNEESLDEEGNGVFEEEKETVEEKKETGTEGAEEHLVGRVADGTKKVQFSEDVNKKEADAADADWKGLNELAKEEEGNEGISASPSNSPSNSSLRLPVDTIDLNNHRLSSQPEKDLHEGSLLSLPKPELQRRSSREKSEQTALPLKKLMNMDYLKNNKQQQQPRDSSSSSHRTVTRTPSSDDQEKQRQQQQQQQPQQSLQQKEAQRLDKSPTATSTISLKINHPSLKEKLKTKRKASKVFDHQDEDDDDEENENNPTTSAAADMQQQQPVKQEDGTLRKSPRTLSRSVSRSTSSDLHHDDIGISLPPRSPKSPKSPGKQNVHRNGSDNNSYNSNTQKKLRTE